MLRKNIGVMLIVMLSSFLLLSCGKTNETTKDDGKEVIKTEAAKEYKTIVVLDPASIEMLYMLGAEDRIAAVALPQMSKVWPEDKTASLPSVGSYIKPSLERILSYEPDLVILNFQSTTLKDELERQGIDTLTLEANSIDEIFANFTTLAKAVGKEEEAKVIATEKMEKISKIEELGPINKKGAFIYSISPLMAFNDKSLPGDILKLFGVKNLTEGLKGDKPILNVEYVLSQDPDFIFTGLGVKEPQEVFDSNPKLREIKAWKNKNVIAINSAELLRGTPRIVDNIYDLYETIKNFE